MSRNTSTKRELPLTFSAAASKRKKRRAAEKEAPMSPQIEMLSLPAALVLQPRQAHPLSTDEAMVIRDRDGRVLARIDALRADLLPN